MSHMSLGALTWADGGTLRCPPVVPVWDIKPAWWDMRDIGPHG